MSRLPRFLRYLIYGVLTLGLCGVSAWAALTFTFGFAPYQAHLRADREVSQAREIFQQVYDQVKETAPKGSVLIHEENPQSETYPGSFGDGMRQYTYLQAKYIYRLTTSFSTILADYEATFTTWGWSQQSIESKTSSLKTLFVSPTNSSIEVGICKVDAAQEYIVFFDYHEWMNLTCYGKFPECLAVVYCKR